ncbi:MAG: AsmA-like C-terminal region-containing protein [Desulfobacterales bacterium]
MPLKLSGSIQPEPENRLRLDMDIAAAAVDLDHLIQVLKDRPSKKQPQTGSKSPPFAVTGNIRFKTDRFTFGDFTLSPVHADASLNNDQTDITIKEAVLCGISMPGTMTLAPETIRFDIKPMAKDQELNPSLNCIAGAKSKGKGTLLTDKTFKADGTYSLQGSFQGNGKAEDLLKTATGQVEYSAADGHIYHDVILLNVLKYLNSTELLTGQTDLAKMDTTGFGYRAINIEASLQNGKILYKKIILDGAALALTAAGELDLLTGRLDLKLLVALQTTLDRIFTKIPLVGGALKTFNTIPLSLKGTLDDLHVFPLSLSSVAYELKRLMENTARGPIKLIQIGRKSAADGQTP